MNIKLSPFVFVLAMIVIIGCGRGSTGPCKPMLFPYSEYGYHAEPEELAGKYKGDDTSQKVEIFGITMELPHGWRFKAHDEWGIKFFMDDGRTIAMFFNKGRSFTDDAKNFNFVGCDSLFTHKSHTTTRTHKEYITSIYLFTDEDLQGEPTFWQYFVLWSKTDILRDAVKLVHFKGKHLEAFQKNHDPRTLCAHSDIACQIEIFPDKISPDSLTIVAGFTDDAFFADLLDMIDTLNP